MGSEAASPSEKRLSRSAVLFPRTLATTKTTMGDPLITLTGSLEILVAIILTVKASVIYDSPPTRALSALTGLVSLRLLPHVS
jgi:hypothetical protein